MPHRLFLPHPKKRSPVLSLTSLLLINAFLLTILLLRTFSINSSGLKILGFATDINVTELFNNTNKARIKNGLSPLTYSPILAKAAEKKAKDMFEDNYWAHIAPDGTTPWDFIKGEGYTYTYAGENLAKDFDKSSSVVKAWLNSPTHRENLLNPNYTEIGFAVVNGILDGEETTLVVQMFGKPVGAKVISKKTSNVNNKLPSNINNTSSFESGSKIVSQPNLNVNKPLSQNPVLLGAKNDKFIFTLNYTYAINFAYFLLGFFMFSLIIDGLVAYKRRHFRLTGNTLSHLVLFIGTLLFLFYLLNPSIL